MNSYPTEHELATIIGWLPAQGETWEELFTYVKERWQYADAGYWQEPEQGVYKISTAGWSGNEDLICAMQENYICWSMCWHESKRGGHYIFKLPS